MRLVAQLAEIVDWHANTTLLGVQPRSFPVPVDPQEEVGEGPMRPSMISGGKLLMKDLKGDHLDALP